MSSQVRPGIQENSQCDYFLFPVLFFSLIAYQQQTQAEGHIMLTQGVKAESSPTCAEGEGRVTGRKSERQSKFIIKREFHVNEYKVTEYF